MLTNANRTLRRDQVEGDGLLTTVYLSPRRHPQTELNECSSNPAGQSVFPWQEQDRRCKHILLSERATRRCLPFKHVTRPRRRIRCLRRDTGGLRRDLNGPPVTPIITDGRSRVFTFSSNSVLDAKINLSYEPLKHEYNCWINAWRGESSS